jgi:murein L,D-transpeptidase YafK
MKRKFLLALAIIAACMLGVACYADWPLSPLPQDARATRIIVYKSARRLSLYSDSTLLRDYRVSLGPAPMGAKQVEGDNKTPEGRYVVDYRNPQSDYHLALHVSYPTPEQVESAKARGVSPGGLIMIHGAPNGKGLIGRLHRFSDWTAGCIALTDDEIEELWRVVPDGTPVEIYP